MNATTECQGCMQDADYDLFLTCQLSDELNGYTYNF